MGVVVVLLTQADLEEAVQGDGVDMILEGIMSLGHRPIQLRLTIALERIAQVIGLVIGDIITVLPDKDQIDEPLHVTLTGAEHQPAQPLGEISDDQIGAMGTKDPLQPRRGHLGQGIVELHLVQTLTDANTIKP